jgi:hypothetical protein
MIFIPRKSNPVNILQSTCHKIVLENGCLLSTDCSILKELVCLTLSYSYCNYLHVGMMILTIYDKNNFSHIQISAALLPGSTKIFTIS